MNKKNKLQMYRYCQELIDFGIITTKKELYIFKLIQDKAFSLTDVVSSLPKNKKKKKKKTIWDTKTEIRERQLRR